jgi:cysteine desulfurase
MKVPIYLDYNATTPVAPEVADAIEPWLREHFGTPSSSHIYGQRAKQAVAQARGQVATLIGAKPGEIVFTGCATEANNLAIRGAARAVADGKRHVITSAVEHPSALQPFHLLRKEGWKVTVLPVNHTGRVDPAEVEKALRPDTVLVSVMLANNEVGTVQPIAEIAALTRPRGILLHTDAAQAVGKIAVNVNELDVDLLTLAGHKFYSPKGVGALYVRTGTAISQIIAGADQERGLRPGTENVPFIVGIGEAARLVCQNLPANGEYLRVMRDRLHALLQTEIPGLILNGHPTYRLPNTLHGSFPDVSGRALLKEAAATVAASVGSACHEEGDQVSGVLAAMGVDATHARGAVRLSVGLFTTQDEIECAGRALVAAWNRLKST